MSETPIPLRTFVTVGDLLAALDQLPWNAGVYLREGRPWALSEPAVLLDAYGDPDFEAEHGVQHRLGIADLRDIVENARAQRPSVGLAGLVEAIGHYDEFDAFVCWEDDGVSRPPE